LGRLDRSVLESVTAFESELEAESKPDAEEEKLPRPIGRGAEVDLPDCRLHSSALSLTGGR
jgi:hypothetical protein